MQIRNLNCALGRSEVDGLACESLPMNLTGILDFIDKSIGRETSSENLQQD